MKKFSRRNFLSSAAALTPSILLPVIPAKAEARLAADPIPAAAVQEFVKVAHNDFDRGKELLAEYPHIINAAWDWGDGDFETAIGAAGHMGHRDFALFLLENGARADIFVLTMLGETDIVKSTLERFPNLLNSLGPHGFTLLHHAQKGGEPAAALLEYVKEMGLTEAHVKIYVK